MRPMLGWGVVLKRCGVRMWTVWGWRGGWIQDKCPPLIGGLMHGGGSGERKGEKLGEGEQGEELGE